MKNDLSISFDKLTVIILNWNGKKDTLECLSSLQHLKHPNFNIIVADNGSSDDSVKTIRTEYPDVFILENGANLGFAEGNNRAIRYALDQGTDAVVLLNNDIIVDPNLLQAFRDAYNSLANPGILGAASYYYDNPKVIWAAGGFWDSTILDLNHIGLGKYEHELPSDKPYEVDYAVGCALFIHKDVISKIGLMEPLFFLNFEENDWCQRAKKAGLINYSVPDAKIWHKVSASFGGESPLWKYYMTRNLLLWSKRHLPAGEHRDVILKTIKACLPSLAFLSWKAQLTLKQRYWALTNWIKQVLDRFKDPFYIAQFHGIYHYFTKKFGECPPELKIKLLSTH
ncbi:hypothetical protein A1353_13175 [Methylomonas methanica]|uniref:Glycosyltransferase 2-like domain-containing protein n=1 Tax=Methylomonas methanica TaxID=421 RepID=A0A177MGV0_METMH|nr:glycosyltransferase family 2 protein [Methylomonas methanica]OAI04694.1 hypothetical protein A1353_13175 [Methylomonas methanica]